MLIMDEMIKKSESGAAGAEGSRNRQPPCVMAPNRSEG